MVCRSEETLMYFTHFLAHFEWIVSIFPSVSVPALSNPLFQNAILRMPVFQFCVSKSLLLICLCFLLQSARDSSSHSDTMFPSWYYFMKTWDLKRYQHWDLKGKQFNKTPAKELFFFVYSKFCFMWIAIFIWIDDVCFFLCFFPYNRPTECLVSKIYSNIISSRECNEAQRRKPFEWKKKNKQTYGFPIKLRVKRKGSWLLPVHIYFD